MAIMDAKNEAHVRELIEIALQDEGKCEAARIAAEAAEAALGKALIRRRDSAINLQGAIRGDVIIYGDRLISVGLSSDGPRVVVRKIEEVAVVAPPVPVEQPIATPVAVSVAATDAMPKPVKPPTPTPLAGGKIPPQTKK